MFWHIYNFLFFILFILFLPKFCSRMIRRGGYKRNFLQRIGIYNKNLFRKNKERIWIHGVSVGEISLALSFINEIKKLHPNLKFLISTNTSTAYNIADENKNIDDVLIYFPIDIPLLINKVIKLFRINNIILIESEFWPNLIRLAHNKKIQITLINNRISVKSYSNFKKFKFLTKKILPMIPVICTQGIKEKEQLIKLGGNEKSIHVVGSMKFDLIRPSGDNSFNTLFNVYESKSFINRVILLGASTWPGEEEILINTYKKLRLKYPHLLLILAPRHEERADDVEKLILNNNFLVKRRTRSLNLSPISNNQILLLDSTGELNLIYKDIDISFIGKSIISKGGQNPIEPAMNKSVVITGPYMENFTSVVNIFDQINARIIIKDESELIIEIEKLLSSTEYMESYKEMSYKAYKLGQGALSKTLKYFEGSLLKNNE